MGWVPSRGFWALRRSAHAAQGRERHMLSKSALLLTVLVTNLPPPLRAHDIYSHLVDAAGQSCCDDRDCRPVPYRMTADGVKMFVDRRWIDVPEGTIQYRALPDDTSETGGGHWCGFAIAPVSEEDLPPVYTTRCAILPPQAASIQVESLGLSGP